MDENGGTITKNKKQRTKQKTKNKTRKKNWCSRITIEHNLP